MRRIAPAIVPALALAAVSVPATPAHSSAPHLSAPRPALHHGQAAASSTERGRSLKGIGLDGSAPGTSFVRVSWNWIKAASGYRIQVSKRQDFSPVVAVRKKRNSAHRPTGGREAATVAHLRDATYFWVRVRKVKGAHKSPWSAPVRVATKAAMPDRITRTFGRLGPTPGTTTIRWKSTGGHTDFYRITTALTPFGSKSHPGQGRHRMTWRAPGHARSFTMTPAQTAAAGAPLGSGRHLFFRVTAVRSGAADRASRTNAHLSSTTVTGRHSSGNGTRLRFAAYNMHVASKDIKGHPWSKRQYLIAHNIAKYSPAVAGIEELMVNMWTGDAGGAGLNAALGKAGAGRYRLTRTTPYWKNAAQDTHILYDPTKVELVSNCDNTVPSCYILLPDPQKHIAAYARFKDLASGQEFYFVSAHLSAGDNAKTDVLRGREATAISNGIKAIDRQDLPVIFATDSNSSQVSVGSDAPHTVLVKDGWYNTQAAAKVVNDTVNSVNHYQKQSPSPYGFGSMYDTIMTLHLPGADLWKQVLTGSPWPSDHNMVFTDLRLP